MLKANKLKIITIMLVVGLGGHSLSGQTIKKIDTTQITQKERDSLTAIDPVKSYTEQHFEDWFSKAEEPLWEKIELDMRIKYPMMNTDSLYRQTKSYYYGMLGDRKNALKELVYLGKTYGKQWDIDVLTRLARILIIYDFGYESDAKRLTQWALKKAKTESERISIGQSTLSRILAKEGARNTAMDYIAKEMPSYNLEEPYVDLKEGIIKKGLHMKMAISDLFEISSGRGGWRGKGMREQYKGKVSFEKDFPTWRKIRDNYIKEAWPSLNADSLMYLGAIKYYDSLNDSKAWADLFETFVNKYGTNDVSNFYLYSYAFYVRSKDLATPELLEQAMYWLQEAFNHAGHQRVGQGKLWELYARLQYELENRKEAFIGIYKAIGHTPEGERKPLQDLLNNMKIFKKDV